MDASKGYLIYDVTCLGYEAVKQAIQKLACGHANRSVGLFKHWSIVAGG